MNKFGGNWTENKIEILVEYAKAYLVIMNKYADKFRWKLMYFDGFAGSGLTIKEKGDTRKVIIGAAVRILEIEEPRPFDEYYFVEKDPEYKQSLEENTKDVFEDKKIHITEDDCNNKLIAMSNFLKSKEGENYKILAYIDPCGMQLEWESLKVLEGLGVDIWILVPTGMGVNRLLKKDGNISEAWTERLIRFLGMNKDEIRNYFYTETKLKTLFGEEETQISKEEKTIEKSAELYADRLKEIFTYVSDTYSLRTSGNVTMYHFLMASNNKSAVKIANEIIRKYKFE